MNETTIHPPDDPVPYHTLVDAGSYDEEGAYNANTDKYDPNHVKVACPACKRVIAVMRSRYTEPVGDTTWEWVGCDHKEPVTRWQSKCAKCGTSFRFKTFIPQ